MPNFLQVLFNSRAFIPHGHCYLWKPGLVGLHLIADSLIALAYFSIPLTLLYFVHKRRDIPFNWVFLLFSAFIISCGTTHLFEIWTLWYPTYWLSGLSKAITALVSLYTAITLVSLMPQALVLPGLAVINQTLEAEIAERRKTETALRESEARFQAFMNNSPTASWITDEMGQLVYISQTYSQVFQIPADYVPQKTDVTLYATELRQQYLQNIQQVVQTREVVQAIELAPTRDGTIGQFLVYKFPIETLAGQCLVGGVAIDITDRIRAEQALSQLNQELEARIEQRTLALQESQAQFRKNAAHLAAAQRIAHLGSWELDLQIQEIIWSEEVFHLFGRDLAAGNPTFAEVQQSIHPADRSYYEQSVQQAIATKQSYEIEFRVDHPDGALRYLQGRGEPVFGADGQLVRLVGTILDITERKQTEAQFRQTNEQLAQINVELARATRLKDEFLANMSHELRTPLNAILGLSEGLQDQVFGPLNVRQIKALGTIERSGRHLLELINDILDLSKIESGKLELHLSEVSIRGLCDASLSFVKEMALKKNIQISTQIPAHLNVIQADDRRLRQVLINLLSNAVKFTPVSGSVRLEAYLEPFRSIDHPPISLFSRSSLSPPPTYYLCFSVIDTGIGIAPDNIDKLFQTFVQIDSSLSRQYSGTGLGLALVRQIITLHGGTVAVNSELGQGSCFTVRIPYAVKEAVPTQHLTPIAASTPLSERNTVSRLEESTPVAEQLTRELDNFGANSLPQLVPPLILLVEDNKANIDTISGYLESRGYRLILATNGQQAVALAQTQCPDLILMDIQMPGMDGLAAIQQIRANGQTQIPIIALTALAMAGDREKCLAAGATEYLTKPIQLKQLTVTIQHLLLPRSGTLP
ncbi:response regulator [Pantanalinema sp. GBBB05]|uniref:response regulator n=1 Tax=Pantanalinema sp. GBBB05 TaxID=2604139 RepID=UPI001DE70731|nr:response regulator [Pantanalinema sp. GBBB05]